MADKKTKPTDDDISGPNVLRFVNAPGFAQRRPKTEKEAKPHAADDTTGRADTVDGDKPQPRG